MSLQIAFAGTSAFAVSSLEALANDPAFEITLVITQPDKPVGRSKAITSPLVKVAAEKLGLQVEQPEDINSPLSILNSQFKRPDFLIVVSYGQILSEEILRWPKIAPVNLHASLLPRWRGASPIQHAILARDRETGVTVQEMVLELDAGPILSQEKTPIGPRETFTELHDRLATLGADLLVRTLKTISESSALPAGRLAQSPSDITLCRKLSRADGIVDPVTMTAEEIDTKVRALTPWPGVTCDVHGVPLKLLETALSEARDTFPLPCTGGTTLFLVTVQPAGKKPMAGGAWGRGRRA